VPHNLLGITDAAKLARAEAALSASRLIDLERQRLPGRYDLARLQAFHRGQRRSKRRAPAIPAMYGPVGSINSEHFVESYVAPASLPLPLLRDFPDPGKFPVLRCSSPSDTVIPYIRLFPGMPDRHRAQATANARRSAFLASSSFLI
jgi:hypothetical protein